MNNAIPVTELASPEARKTAALAIPSGPPTRPIGNGDAAGTSVVSIVQTKEKGQRYNFQLHPRMLSWHVIKG